MTFDPSDDYLIFDGIETVSLIARSRAGGGTGATVEAAAVEVAGAFREELSQRDLLAGEGFLRGQAGMAWNLPGPTLAGKVPKQLDVIEDSDDVRWIVTSVTYHTLVKFYRCVCYREVT